MEDTWGSLEWGVNGMTFPKIPLNMEKFMILSGRTAERKSLGKWDAGMPGALMFTAGMDLTDHQASCEGGERGKAALSSNFVGLCSARTYIIA